jgi:hypothetical protein
MHGRSAPALPEREAMNHLGHKSKAVHAAYGSRASITTLPLEYYEMQKAKKIIEFSEVRKDNLVQPEAESPELSHSRSERIDLKGLVKAS